MTQCRTPVCSSPLQPVGFHQRLKLITSQPVSGRHQLACCVCHDAVCKESHQICQPTFENSGSAFLRPYPSEVEQEMHIRPSSTSIDSVDVHATFVSSFVVVLLSSSFAILSVAVQWSTAPAPPTDFDSRLPSFSNCVWRKRPG